MHAPHMLFAALVFIAMNLWHVTVCEALPFPPTMPVASPPQARPVPTAIAVATPVESTNPIAPTAQPDGGEMGILKAQVAALDKVLDQMQKVDSKIANLAPWIAA